MICFLAGPIRKYMTLYNISQKFEKIFLKKSPPTNPFTIYLPNLFHLLKDIKRVKIHQYFYVTFLTLISQFFNAILAICKSIKDISVWCGCIIPIHTTCYLTKMSPYSFFIFNVHHSLINTLYKFTHSIIIICNFIICLVYFIIKRR